MAIRRYEISDFEWSIMSPLLPNKPRGVAQVEDRKVLTAFIGGCGRVRPGQTFRSAMAHTRSATTALSDGVNWAFGTLFLKLFQKLMRETCKWSTPPRSGCTSMPPIVKKGAGGRSRGGLTTKIHAVLDANGNPFTLKLTEGQAHDGRSADDMLDTVGKDQTLLADRAYDSDALRATLAARGAKANVKPMPNRVNIPKFNKQLYKKRNLVERFFNKLKHFRAIATRFEKHDANYLALVKLASARIWMRFMSR
jgi:transposase